MLNLRSVQAWITASMAPRVSPECDRATPCAGASRSSLVWPGIGTALDSILQGGNAPGRISRRLCRDHWCNAMYVCILCTVSQRMVHEHDSEHGLGDGRGANTHTWIVAPVRLDDHGSAGLVD